MRSCTNSSCLADCTFCNRAPIENRALPCQTAASFAIADRGCGDAACRGNCAWCNRASIESSPVATDRADRIAA